MESEIIKAVGQLSVEVIAIIALAVTVFFQAKAAANMVKAMNKLSNALEDHERRNVKNIVRIAEGVKSTEKIAESIEKSVEQHQKWSEAAVNKIINARI